jgi:hypothetical protein
MPDGQAWRDDHKPGRELHPADLLPEREKGGSHQPQLRVLQRCRTPPLCSLRSQCQLRT